MKNKNKTTTRSSISKKQNNVAAIGHIDIEVIFDLSDDLLAKYKTKWDDINSANDLEFLNKEGDMANIVSLQSTNNLVNTLLYLNKTSSEKFRIDFITLNEMLVILKNDEEKFLKSIFKNVTEQNNLFIHEKEIVPETKSKLLFTIRNNTRIKTFRLRVEKEKKDGKHEKESTEKKIIKEDIFANLNLASISPDVLLLDLENFLNISSDQSGEILEYFQKFLESITNRDEKLKIILSYSNVMNRIRSLNIKTLESLVNIFSICDILLFEKKEIQSLFNLIYQIKESDGGADLKHLPEKELTGYLTKTINFDKKGRKVCLLLDDFQRISILEIAPVNGKKIIFERTKGLNLFPKINHTNQKVVEEYKKILSQNYSFFKSVLFGSFLSKYLNSPNTLTNPLIEKEENIKTYYSSYLCSKEITKKILESTKNNSNLPTEKEYYLVKIPQSVLDKEIQKEDLKSKEDRFILDCVNEKLSRLKFYHPLYDGHLNLFFSSEINRRQLKDKGFINTNGFIMYDGLYRDVMGPSPKKNSDMIKRNYGSHRNLHLGEESKENPFSSSKILESGSPTKKKLPVLKFEYLKNPSSARGKIKLKPINKTNLIDNKNMTKVDKSNNESSKKKESSHNSKVNHEDSNFNLYSSKDK